MIKLKLIAAFSSCFIAGYIISNYFASSNTNHLAYETSLVDTCELELNASTSNRQYNLDVPVIAQGSSTDNDNISDSAIINVAEHQLNQAFDNKDNIATRNATDARQRYANLRNTLQDNPALIQDTVAKLAGLSSEDPEFNLLISAIQSTSSKEAEQALLELAEQYALNNDLNSQSKFIALLSSTSSNIKSPLLVQGLFDIAATKPIDSNTKVAALNLLQPYQLTDFERQQIVNDLEHSIIELQASEAEILLSQLMRFSPNTQRSDIASNMLSNNPDSIRLAVFDNIRSGSIPVNDTLKQQLLEIAHNASDPLRFEAQNTLITGFDLSHQEYALLTQN